MLKLNQFGPKAHAFAFRPPEQLARINILSGAIRSSKTTAVIPQIFAACASKKPGHKLISGVSKSTIKNNILGDVFSIAGEENYTYNAQSGDLTLFGSKFIVSGAKDEGSERYIRGLTLSWAYVDEAVLTPKSFWMMLVGRLSVGGATLIATTNPANPTHWLYDEWITDKDKLTSGDVWVEHFRLEDNPSLDPEYVRSIKRLYTGVWYQRMILGRWIAAEGAIFRDCFTDDLLYDDAEEPIGLRNAGGCVERIIAIDFGVDNPCVFLDIYDDGNIWWVADEYRWDSKREGRQKSNSEYIQDLVDFIGPEQNAYVVVDPSAASFKVELSARGIIWFDADNDVYQGILKTSSILTRKMARFNRQKCADTIKEMNGYSWNPKSSERGIEEPIKSKDHGPDAFRYACYTRFNSWRLMLPTAA